MPSVSRKYEKYYQIWKNVANYSDKSKSFHFEYIYFLPISDYIYIQSLNYEFKPKQK